MIRQIAEKVEEILRAIGGGSLLEGEKRMAKHTGLQLHSVKHWMINGAIPESRWSDVQNVAHSSGIDWTPEHLDDKRIARRKCLSCQGDFVSEHKGNRICKRCNDTKRFRESSFQDDYRILR